MIVNLSTFADLAGVGKSCITLTVQRGKLVTTADGFIDTENEINAAYLAKRKSKAAGEKAPEEKKPAKKRGRPKSATTKTKPKKTEPKDAAPERQPTKQEKKATTKLEHLDGVELPNPETELDDVDDEPLDQLDKLAADVRLKNAQAKRHELKFEQDKGNVVKVELVERMAERVRNEIKSRLQDLPRRVTPRIAAMARSGSDDKEIQIALEREIDDGLEAVAAVLRAPLV